MTLIEQVFAEYLQNKYIPILSSSKIALVGEKTKSKAEDTLCRAISKGKDIPLKNITIFTTVNKFKVEDGEKFDYLLGCRPCDGEQLILEAAAKYKKPFVIMPCSCHCLPKKVVRYIREYPVITSVDTREGTAWLFLS